MTHREVKVPSTTAGCGSGIKMSTSNHMGWERVYLEQLHVLNQALKRTEEELYGILDRLTSDNLEFQQKIKEKDTLTKQREEIERKVEYHRRAQTEKKGEVEQ